MLSKVAAALGGLLFGIAIVAALELLLRVLGIAEDAPRHDPFSGFSSAVRTFELETPPGEDPIYRLSPARSRAQRDSNRREPEYEFAAANGFRVFVIGGSSSQGVPYPPGHSFASWLQRRLSASLPDRHVEVVNAALSGYASRRLLPIVHEIAGYEPDALVVYMGHNEWAEKKYYSHLLGIPPLLFRILEWGYQTRIYALASRLLDLEAFDKSADLDLPAERNAAQMFGVVRGRASGESLPTPRELEYRDLLYEHNLTEMANTMISVGARPILLTLSQNFSDWPPPLSTHRPDLDATELAAWERHVDDGHARLARDGCAAALPEFEQAAEIDAEYAELQFEIAGCLRELGRFEEARARYRLASDLDRVPQGAPTNFNTIIRRVAKSTGALLVDIDAVANDESGEHLVGDDLFTDFAHPRLRTHQLIASAIADAMRRADFPIASAQWRQQYVDPDPEQMHRENPQLRVLELQSRLFACLLAPRDGCEQEARQTLTLDPTNPIAPLVQKKIGADAADRAGNTAP